MSKPFISSPRATSIATGLLLIGLAPIAYYDQWWPYIMINIGAALAIRQFLLKKIYDGFISLIVFGGIFATFYFNLSWLPVLFVVAGIYVLFKASQGDTESLIEDEEEIQKEIEENNEFLQK